jgi:hypothetical protein
LPNLALWLDAADTATITESGGAVSQWDDKSGNGYNVTQGTGAAQPTTGSTTQNGLNVLSFDGGDRMSASTAADWKFLNDGTLYTIFIVGSVTNSGATFPSFAGTTAGNNLRGIDVLIFRSTRAIRHIISGATDASVVNNTSAGGVFEYAKFFVFMALSDASNATAASRSTITINGGLDIRNNSASGAISNVDPPSPFTVGGRTNTDGFTRLTGNIAEVLIIKNVLTSPIQKQVQSYLFNKWGIAL